MNNQVIEDIVRHVVSNIEVDQHTRKFITNKDTIQNYVFVNNGNIEDTKAHLLCSIEWRRKNLADKYIDIYNQNREDVCILYRQSNNPVIYCSLGTKLDIENLFNYICCLVENELLTKNAKNYILVFDCRMVGIDYLLNLNQIIQGIKTIKQHFPERLKNLFIVNSNPTINTIYDGIDFLLNDHIKKKIKFITDYDVLLEEGHSQLVDYLNNN